jgi:peptidyl-prolyl cis-trans isomerase A (cyclophilin A)
MHKTIYFFSFVICFTSCVSAKYSDLSNGLYAEIQTNKGDILLVLHAKEVPMTVANFVSLAEGKNNKVVDSLKGAPYYDGLVFHRVIKNFMIQGGDPTGTGTGNTGYKFADEFSTDSLGVLIHKHDDKGVLSMANGGPNSNSSQFFITHKATPWLDNDHTVFGKVQIGVNILDSIQKNDTIKKVEIIRVGKFAKKFEAFKVFEIELNNAASKEKAYLAKSEKRKLAFLKVKGIQKAIKTDSGLKILALNKGRGKKFNRAGSASMYFSIYLASGKLVQSIDKTNDPFTFILDKQPMIAGVTEALLNMKEGDKNRLFIPYYLGYGEDLYGPFPQKSDLVFEVELIKVGK